MPDYADLPNTKQNSEMQIQSDEKEIIIDVANQGTQAIEENSDEMTVQNEEEWANAITEIVNQTTESSPQRPNEPTATSESTSNRLLINAPSTRLIPPDQDYLMIDKEFVKNKHQSSNKAEHQEQ